MDVHQIDAVSLPRFFRMLQTNVCQIAAQRFASDASVCDHGVGLQHQKKCRWNVKKAAVSECSQEFNVVKVAKKNMEMIRKNDAT